MDREQPIHRQEQSLTMSSHCQIGELNDKILIWNLSDPVQYLSCSYDFYLISQSTRQGCVSPTSYNVLWDDEGGLTPDRIQILSYKLCHLYFNYTGTLGWD